VVCNAHHRFLVAEQLRAIGSPAGDIILEPVGRNTAPAVAIAALAALAGTAGEDALILVMPADHCLRDVGAFQAAVEVGITSARQGHLVTFGVVPTAAEVGYGYIRRAQGEGPSYPIAEFVEKPDAERAAQYVASGDYLWNSGMFLFSARRFVEELDQFNPGMLSACRKAFEEAHRDLDFVRLGVESFSQCPSDSIDYAVMEKTRAAVVVPLEAGWSDVGSWSALHESLPADSRGNVARGDVVTEDTSGCYLYSSERLIATVGLTDTVVVETKDAVLVAPKSRVQDVKALVAKLKAADRTEPSLHREVFRPWGSYDSVDNGDRFQVKRLVVNPGATLSLQMHHHRAEHWIVVSGTAEITCDDRVFLMSENQSTFIPVGAKHRIANPGRVPLHIIEVQSGSYLGEDDIVRFADNYGRQGTNT
jgi:mannose-1-phosphate guanylyltransferase/mannose-6-phosphate isomerase